jgi:hypothetical protein
VNLFWHANFDQTPGKQAAGCLSSAVFAGTFRRLQAA